MFTIGGAFDVPEINRKAIDQLHHNLEVVGVPNSIVVALLSGSSKDMADGISRICQPFYVVPLDEFKKVFSLRNWRVIADAILTYVNYL